MDAALGHGPVKNWFGGSSRLSAGAARRPALSGATWTWCGATAARASTGSPPPGSPPRPKPRWTPWPTRWCRVRPFAGRQPVPADRHALPRRPPVGRSAQTHPGPRQGASRTPSWMGSTGSGRPTGPARLAHPGQRCACWHRSTLSSGTVAALSCCGAGPTASRPTPRRRQARAQPLRLAAAVARSGHRLGQPQGRGRRAEGGAGLRGEAPRDPAFAAAPADKLAAIERFLGLAV